MYIAIASQTAGPNWLNLCDGTQKYVKKNYFYYLNYLNSTGNSGHFS